MSEPQTSVLLLQVLCPARHCILGFAGEAPPLTRESIAADARQAIEAAIAAKVLNPWCGICRAEREHWSFEVAELPGRTMAEIEPEIRRQETNQMAARAAFEARERAARN